jgi:hypothetical protein
LRLLKRETCLYTIVGGVEYSSTQNNAKFSQL